MKEYNKKDLFRYEGHKCHNIKTQSLIPQHFDLTLFISS